MKFRGGYNITLRGRPSKNVRVMPEPQVLRLPLSSKRFNFSSVCVEDGQKVETGEVLASDPDNFSVPLIAPRSGTVDLGEMEGYIVLKDISITDTQTFFDEDNIPHAALEMGSSGTTRHKLLTLGAWQFFSDAYTGDLPDPMAHPQAVIVSTLSLEPYLARGDIQLNKHLLQFTRGLEYIQSLLEYQPIYLVLPDIKSIFASKVKKQIRGYAWAKLVEVPLEYTRDDFNILARHIGLKRADGPIFSVRTEGVLAVDRALTLSEASTERIVSVAGPWVNKPEHINVVTGYPIEDIVEGYAKDGQMRLLNGGMFTGEKIDDYAGGIDSECRGITILAEHTEREFLGWLRPGMDRSSYANCFVSKLRGGFEEKFTTTVRGEKRACISCNFCEEVCPAAIMPHLIHKYLYSDMIEEVMAARVDLCVQCGLCTFVCPSKIKLRHQFAEANIEIEKELAEAERHRKKEEEALRKEQEKRQDSEETLY